jgi:2-octaprenyl-6-methoxyphenol hydroxylase
MLRTALDIAIVGAGPAGLALALHAARALPHARITLLDARPADRDVGADPRTLALSLGSVQLLRRLDVWPVGAAQPIDEVHVSQVATGRPGTGRAVRIRARDEAVPMLGAVLRYGELVAPMQRAWEQAAAASPERLRTRFGTVVAALKPVAAGVEVDAGIAEAFDVAIVAEGGVFAEQSRRLVAHDYAQTAWVGEAMLAGGDPGTAFERFTPDGPLALLPLRPPGTPDPDHLRPVALVWCTATARDAVAGLDGAARLARLRELAPHEAGSVVSLGPLKAFALGLNAERTLVDGRTVRIGNAAQTLHPVAGQGLNLGLRDVHVLVDALRFGGDDLDRALARVEWTRAPDRWATIATTDFLARSFTWQLPGASLARALGLSALEAVPPLKSAFARRMMFGLR